MRFSIHLPSTISTFHDKRATGCCNKLSDWLSSGLSHAGHIRELEGGNHRLSQFLVLFELFYLRRRRNVVFNFTINQ